MSKRYSRPMTPEEMAATPDEDIDFSDIPELDEEWFENAIVVPAGYWTEWQEIRVSPEVFGWFQSRGKDYTAQINAVLRAHIERERAKNPKQAAE